MTEISIAEAMAELDALTQMVRDLADINQLLVVENRQLRSKIALLEAEKGAYLIGVSPML